MKTTSHKPKENLESGNGTLRPLTHMAQAVLSLTLIATPWLAGTAKATINVGSATVSSVGHSFTPAQTSSGFVGDYLVDQNQNEGGGATLGAVSINLDNDTQYSFTISAPAGERFLITVPTGATPEFNVDFGWRTPNGDSGGSLSFNASFQGLAGTAPTFTNSSAVGTNNQFFTFNSDSSTFSSSFSFSSVTFTVAYAARSTGDGVLTEQPFDPRNSGSVSGANLEIGYQTGRTTDPGRFVTIVPEPSAWTLLGLGLPALLAFGRATRRVATRP